MVASCSRRGPRRADPEGAPEIKEEVEDEDKDPVTPDIRCSFPLINFVVSGCLGQFTQHCRDGCHCHSLYLSSTAQWINTN